MFDVESFTTNWIHVVITMSVFSGCVCFNAVV